jgi:hypothetical protein
MRWRLLAATAALATIAASEHGTTVGRAPGTVASVASPDGGITFTYDLLTGRCAASHGTCRSLLTHAICAQNPSQEQIRQNDAALRSFNAEAQRHTRPSEPGYAGGNYISDNGYPGHAGADAYPDANIENRIILQIAACNKLQYTWNEFTMLIRHIKVVGAGSHLTVLQNVSNRYFHNDVSGRANYDFFGDAFYGVVDDSYPTDSYGYLMDTADAGAVEVTLKQPSETQNFYVGRWVMVMSYVQDSMGSYPPNMRYYDFAKVAGIDRSRGSITLDTPLAFAHLESRPYSGVILHSQPSIAGNGIGAGIVGPARIVNIDTPTKPVAEDFELVGIHFLRNPRSSFVNEYSDGWEFTGAIEAEGDDLVFDGAVDSAEMRDFTLTNSSAFYEEADKIIARARYINDTFVNSLLHSGQLVWHATGGAYGGEGKGEVSCAALNCIIDGGAVLSAARRGSGPHPDVELDRIGLTDRISMDGVVFRGSGALGNVAVNGWQGVPRKIGSEGIRLLSGPNGPNTRLAISKCLKNPSSCTDMEFGGTIAQEVTSNWGEHSNLVRDGGLVPNVTISAITGDADNIYIDIEGAALALGQTVYFTRVNTVSITNSTFAKIGNGCNPASGPVNCIRYPVGRNIPTVIWLGNRGD